MVSHDQEAQTTGVKRGMIAAWRNRLGAVALVAVGGALGGCEVDSFLDPSTMGRFEHTPTIVPILERIASVERDDEDFVETTDVVPEDLIPLATEFQLGPGDQVEIRVRDYYRVGQEESFPQVVDKRGYIFIPRLPPIRVQGMTPTQMRDEISRIIQQEGVLAEAVVTVLPVSVRQNTFSAFGSVGQPGTYFIPNADYRLLEALTTAGGWLETAPEIYIIRQVALSERITGPTGGVQPTQNGTSDQPQRPEQLIDLIDELSRPPQTPPSGPAPGVIGGTGRDGLATSGTLALRHQPTGEANPPPVDLPDAMRAPAQGGTDRPSPRPGFSWVFLNGEWVRVSQGEGAAQPGEPGADGLAAEQLVTQRVIRVPMGPLISGARKYNIVIRPGDIIRVPVVGQGIVYLGGQIARPGTYGIPVTGKLTLLRAVDAAGGLNQLAIPQRVDITRMVGPSSQAMIRVNLRAIDEGTQPDIFLKPDDRIIIGTNFWAYPLAVLRGGFRVSYGFGFLLDRNFGSDVFGAPPAERQ